LTRSNSMGYNRPMMKMYTSVAEHAEACSKLELTPEEWAIIAIHDEAERAEENTDDE